LILSLKYKNLIRGVGICFTVVALAGLTSHSDASESPIYRPASGGFVHYNWGTGSPPDFPVNNFKAIFDQSGYFNKGDYFIQTLADDGIKVSVDGKYLIDRWTDSGGDIDRALLLNLSEGSHKVQTEYYENGGDAAVFSDIVPFDSWLAYYYPNRNLSGLPTAAKVISPKGDLKKLYEDHGTGGPVSGFQADDFSAKYVTATRIPEGDYVLRTKADDGVRVYVDGKLVIDRWTNGWGQEDATKISIKDRNDSEERDVHWIEVHYYEAKQGSSLEFFLEPFEKVIEDSWVGEIYPNMNLEGIPYVIGGRNSTINIGKLDFNWGYSSPHSKVPGDRFSARFTKKQSFEEGIYQFEARVDDGIRVWVDDQKVIDAWHDSGADQLKLGKIALDEGEHTIKVEYYENTGLSQLNINFLSYSKVPTQKVGNVHYNWGAIGPGNGIGNDYFTAVFDQSRTFESGDYFIQTLADDGIKVEVNGKWLIDRWSDSSGDINRALWLGVKEGEQTVKTHYYENSGEAAVFSDIVPFDSWLAYYYPNQNLAGLPTLAKVISPEGDLKKLYENLGTGGPVPGFQTDDFSAKYTTVKRLPAGDYVFRTRADDGFRVYVDGKLIIDRWTNGWGQEDAVKVSIQDNAVSNPNERDVHWIEVQYFDAKQDSKIEFFIEPFKSTAKDSWVGEIFPNMNLQGTPYVIGGNHSSINLGGVDFNWGNSSPYSKVPSDRFSARFTKIVNLEEGVYQFEARSDDGIRIYVDDQKVIDAWKDSGADQLKVGKIALTEGEHTIKVEYYENSGLAQLTVNYHEFYKLPIVKGGEVHFNWGNNSPVSGAPTDYFTAVFDQSRSFKAGDYFIQTLADDGIKVEADGKWLINRWNDSSGEINRALWLDVNEGTHTVKTNYYENSGDAAVFSDIVPFDSWLVYYYPNRNLAGLPTAAKMISPDNRNKLSENHGAGGPVSGYQADEFSAKYTTAKRIPEGDYILRTSADDGVRVYIDGQLVVDRWMLGQSNEEAIKVTIRDRNISNAKEKDIHWIEVQYFEAKGDSKVDFSLESYEAAIDGAWVGELYPNANLDGTPTIIGGKNATNSIPSIHFNWGNGSPAGNIPVDQFSTRYVKKEKLEAGTYEFTLLADDGVRVWVDNKLIADYWVNSDVSKIKKEAVFLEEGTHKIVIEYKENYVSAQLDVDYKKISSSKIFYQYDETVHYDWGTNSPNDFFPADQFEGYFDQSRNLAGGDYFIQSYADDGVQVLVDDQIKINRWSDSSGTIDQALWLNVQPGKHNIVTKYYENTGDAFVYVDVLPFDSWIAYYYPNTTLSGKPGFVKSISPSGPYKMLVDNNANGSPSAEKIPADNFSAKYRTAKRLPAGDYVLRTRVDDGIRVYIDGQLITDKWSYGSFNESAIPFTVHDRNVTDPNEKDVHFIEVQYVEFEGLSNLELFIQPLSEVLNTDQWVGYLYPKQDLTGNPVILGGVGAQTPLSEINFNWGANQPHSQIPADNFSARFIKKGYFKTGVYQIKTWSDDGIRVYVDGNKVIDSWVDSATDYEESLLTLEAGIHEIKVEYYDNLQGAELKVDIVDLTSQNAKFVSAVKLPVYRSLDELRDYTKHLTYYNPSYTRYFELGYGDIVYVLEESLYAARIRTQDGRIGWVHKDYLENNLMDDYWLIKEARTLRSDSSSTASAIGTVPAGSKLKVLKYVKTPGTTYTEWYYIQTESGQRGWIWGAISPDGNSGYNLIKYEFDKVGKTTNQLSIFTPLNTKATVTADQINSFINYKTQGKTTLMTGMGYAYLEAQEQSGLNAIYLLAHSGLETGWGTSAISKNKYNFYGIGAIDSKPAEGAYDYTTPEGGIIAGAIWISENYVIRSWDTDEYLPYYQPTLDNMRYDNSWHQYASDEAWAVKIGYFMQEFYNFINR
jgi:beta-N-acetylglucosaminidase/RNase P/RNase MRP subunit p29